MVLLAETQKVEIQFLILVAVKVHTYWKQTSATGGGRAGRNATDSGGKFVGSGGGGSGGPGGPGAGSQGQGNVPPFSHHKEIQEQLRHKDEAAEAAREAQLQELKADRL